MMKYSKSIDGSLSSNPFSPTVLFKNSKTKRSKKIIILILMIDFRKKNKKKAKVKVEGGNYLDLDTPDIPDIDDSTRYTVLQLLGR